jgi:hypothetical protein
MLRPWVVVLERYAGIGVFLNVPELPGDAGRQEAVKAGRSLLFGIVLIQSAGPVTTGKGKSGTPPAPGCCASMIYGRTRPFVTAYSITCEHKKLAFRKRSSRPKD